MEWSNERAVRSCRRRWHRRPWLLAQGSPHRCPPGTCPPNSRAYSALGTQGVREWPMRSALSQQGSCNLLLLQQESSCVYPAQPVSCRCVLSYNGATSGPQPHWRGQIHLVAEHPGGSPSSVSSSIQGFSMQADKSSLPQLSQLAGLLSVPLQPPSSCSPHSFPSQDAPVHLGLPRISG